ncbi:MAG: peptide-methionine (S)-S-oxide reductase MsrA [Burkholderiaceae bacterium]|nr:peptide-methionine (S)-S-oxide reductase MsrA [Burkholderiaceae bacterium]
MDSFPEEVIVDDSIKPKPTEVAIFGGGCFWCTEAVFSSVLGVLSVKSGYCGGSVSRPTYEDVCTGATGHIEVVRVLFDPSIVSYRTLVEIFFASHDPTTPGRQGNDVGPQYQSAIFWQSDEQREVATQVLFEVDASYAYSDPVCTELIRGDTFWPAEPVHDQYFSRHPEQGYCRIVIAPKVAKFRQKFADKLKN